MLYLIRGYPQFNARNSPVAIEFSARSPIKVTTTNYAVVVEYSQPSFRLV